ncbi:MAG: carbon-nitrogen hydrolase family protein [Bacteriovorax sp.]
MKLRIASAQYDMPVHESFDQWKIHAEKWVSEAVKNGAKLLVFPEYGSIELISIFSSDIQKDLKWQLNEIQKFREEFVDWFEILARNHQVSIVAPSFPWKESESRFVNRAYVLFYDKKSLYQEKQVMTRFEDEDWLISSGERKMHTFLVDGVKCGISICYDIEFPDFSRTLALEGAELIIAPSCTETLAGMNRVHIGARARALENQAYVVVSQTVGNVSYSEAVDKNTGMAAVYSTCDKGLPDDGIIVRGEVNDVGWVYADLDFSKIEKVRREGSVLNFRDIPKDIERDIEIK